MSVAHETLPLSIDELERTREPLERATKLPRAAFTDPACSSGSSSTSSGAAGSASGTSTRSRERGDYLTVELGGESVIVVADDDGRPARVPQHLPPPRRAPRRRARGHGSGACSARTTRGPTASTASLRNAPYTDEIEDFDPQLLRAARRSAWRSSRGSS